jgi:Cys-tRNA(Pro)/Cys-tRNA(Cys) deacylase
MKTRAAQILDNAGIRYEMRQFQEEELTAAEAAKKLDIPLAQVFKTLVARGDRTGVVLVCIPGTMSLSLKALAKASGNKKAEMVEVDEIHRLTGYLRGGVSPLGLKKPYPVYLDESALQHPFLCVSAGMRGMQIIIAPQELARAARATLAPLGEAAGESTR